MTGAAAAALGAAAPAPHEVLLHEEGSPPQSCLQATAYTNGVEYAVCDALVPWQRFTYNDQHHLFQVKDRARRRGSNSAFKNDLTL
jgi:hypothetical protein